jgi:hypothetical protein
MAAFMTSTSEYRVLAGPIGAGKSVCCAHTLLYWASLQEPSNNKRRTRFLIVRNTKDQLMSTTYKTITEWLPLSESVVWRASEKTLYIKMLLPDETILQTEWMFIALDDPDDVRKALSLEATGAWLNEWREIHPDVVEGILSRTGRFPPPKDGIPITRSGAIMDTNMPTEDTWHYERMENPPATWSVHIQPPAILNEQEYKAKFGRAPGPTEITGAGERKWTINAEPIPDNYGNVWWVNPESDNLGNLKPDYYALNIPGKKEDFIRSFLRCMYSRSLAGLPVYDKTFVHDFHVAKETFKPLKSPNHPIVIGLDFGRTPAAALMQRNTRGQIIVLAEATSENMGLERFVETKLRPLLTQERFIGCVFVVAPDPSGFFKQQLGEKTPVDVLRGMGFKCEKPATNKAEPRVQAVERQLVRQIDGKAGFLINPECVVVIRGFRGGYRYKLNRKGEMDGDSPEKNASSHVHDAVQYGCLVLEAGVSGSALNQRREVETVKYYYG